MNKINAKLFLKNLYELSGKKEGAEVIVTDVKPKHKAGLINFTNAIKATGKKEYSRRKANVI